MNGGAHRALQRAVRRILRPLVRVLLRNGVDCNALQDEVRYVYAEVAMREFQVPGRKPSVSRAATISGLHRKEVARQLARDPGAESGLQPQNRAAHVIAGWVRDPVFLGPDGQPRELGERDEDRGFPELVRRYSGDMTVRAVRDELERVGAVAREQGRLRLLTRAYVPVGDDAELIDILGVDTHYLLETMRYNLDAGGGRFQRKVLYDNLPEEFVARFRATSAERCQTLLETFDREMAAADRDSNPGVGGSGRYLAGIGMYYFEEDLGGTGADETERQS